TKGVAAVQVGGLSPPGTERLDDLRQEAGVGQALARGGTEDLRRAPGEVPLPVILPGHFVRLAGGERYLAHEGGTAGIARHTQRAHAGAGTERRVCFLHGRRGADVPWSASGCLVRR